MRGRLRKSVCFLQREEWDDLGKAWEDRGVIPHKTGINTVSENN